MKNRAKKKQKPKKWHPLLKPIEPLLHHAETLVSELKWGHYSRIHTVPNSAIAALAFFTKAKARELYFVGDEPINEGSNTTIFRLICSIADFDSFEQHWANKLGARDAHKPSTLWAEQLPAKAEERQTLLNEWAKERDSFWRNWAIEIQKQVEADEAARIQAKKSPPVPPSTLNLD